MKKFSTEAQMYTVEGIKEDAKALAWGLNIIAHRTDNGYGQEAWRQHYRDYNSEDKSAWERGYEAAMRDIAAILTATRFGFSYAQEILPAFEEDSRCLPAYTSGGEVIENPIMCPPEACEVDVTVSPSCISVNREESYIIDTQNRFRKFGTGGLYENEEVTSAKGNKVCLIRRR